MRYLSGVSAVALCMALASVGAVPSAFAQVAKEEVLSGPAAAAMARAARKSTESASPAAPANAKPAAPAAPVAVVAPIASGPQAAAQARARARGADPQTTASLPASGGAVAKPKRRVAKKAPKNWKQALQALKAKKLEPMTDDTVSVVLPKSSNQDVALASGIAAGSLAVKPGKAGRKLAKPPKPLEPIIDDTAIFGGLLQAGEEPLTDKGLPVIAAENIEPMKAAIGRYQRIVDSGGWPTVPALQMEVGTTHAAVASLRKRLVAEGLLSAEIGAFSSEEYYGTDVEAAVRLFQQRNGLTPTGEMLDKDRAKNGSRTVKALNVPAAARLAQLKVNLGRVQNGVKWASNRYVVVNIPDQEVHAVENGRVVLRLAGVVGRPDRPSPALTSTIHDVKFNPTWTMPPTVIKEDFIPQGRALAAKGVNLLRKSGIDAFDGSGRRIDPENFNFSSASAFGYRFVQQPSKDNPLGFAKLEFASPEAVYMHDTPSAKLFGNAYRAASSGCIRVEDMEKLVRWLLKDTEGWSAERVAQMKATGESEIVRLAKGVPLQWVYVTAWADADGAVHFRRDIYGRDQAHGVDKLAAAY